MQPSLSSVLAACALESLLHVPRKVITLVLFREKTSIGILALTSHPLLSQNREALPYLLSFSLKLSVNLQAG